MPDEPVKDNVDYLPIWKKGASPSDRLEELALIARKHPERFAQFAVVYVETLRPKDEQLAGRIMVRTWEHGCSITEAVGLYELGKLHYFDESKR
jgi:uncharacterized protein YeaO (DUF488 family)